MGRAEDIIRQVCSLESIAPEEEWVKVSAECGTFFSVCIKLNREAREQNPVAVEAEVQAMIFENSLAGEVIIYTDGSVVRHQRCAWAFTAQVDGTTLKEDSGAFAETTSSMTMEVRAVTEAIAWLETQCFTQACFLSDSMSMIRKIEKGWARRQWLVSLARSTLAKIIFIFVPGHAGVRGNERADRLAAEAVVGNGQAMDRADVMSALREVGRINEERDVCESVTMDRLQEHHVERGVARHECFSGSQRRMINQHRTGVVRTGVSRTLDWCTEDH